MKKLLLTIALGIASNGLATQAAFAASEDECAIWLCLPGGFPDGCGAAYSAMKHRLKHFKPPLPAFSSCAAKTPYTNPEDFTHTYRRVLKIEKHRECEEWGTKGHNDTQYCKSYKTIEAHYRAGNSCYKKIGSGKEADYEHIPGCVAALREVKVFEKGKLLGEPYYF